VSTTKANLRIVDAPKGQPFNVEISVEHGPMPTGLSGYQIDAMIKEMEKETSDYSDRLNAIADKYEAMRIKYIPARSEP